MTDALPANREASAATATGNEETPAKRRKVRKGTRSCWECKRRKIRCSFASSQDATCIGCQSRGAPCVGQETIPDLTPSTTGNRHLGERIARVEDLMKDLVAGKCVGAQPNNDGGLVRHAHSLNSTPSSKPPWVPLTPAKSLEESTPRSSSFSTTRSQGVSDLTETERTALHHLLAAFPTGEDATILLRESPRPCLYTELINTQAHSKLTYERLAAPQTLAELSIPNVHPVVLARRMLIFAITLQSPSGEVLVGLSEPRTDLMQRLVTAATTWVTTKEEMQGTVDSLICIILEGVFETNCGNIRRAWIAFRRAMTVAQLMGIHRSPMPHLKRIDPDLDADPEFIWFRILFMDRYLSLLLGLPGGASVKTLGPTPLLRDEPPSGWFERQLTIIASSILDRNESSFSTADIETTQSLDSQLLQVAKSMPASFWRPANFNGLAPGSPETLLETVRLAAHVYYYGLLTQLHLPYMIHNKEEGPEYPEYSKITCVNASREIMARFIAHRSFNPMSSCSRPVDFFALLSAMTLLLAHLDTSSRHSRAATDYLAHVRLSDRAMLGQAVETMDAISSLHGDVLTQQSAKLIRRLIDLEADAAEGNSYVASSVAGLGSIDDGDAPADGAEEEGEELHLDIPYLGRIKIARQRPILRELPSTFGKAAPPLCPAGQVDLPSRESASTRASGDALVFLPQASHSRAYTDCPRSALQPEEVFDPTRSGGMGAQPGHEQPSETQLLSAGYDLQPVMLPYPDSIQDDVTAPELPGIVASVEDWAFQGVDAAFFNSLVRGNTYVDAVASLEDELRNV